MSASAEIDFTSEGQRLFREFVAEKRLTNVQVAAELQVDKSTVTLWLRRGVTPEARYRRAIEKFTEERVPAQSWETEAERNFVDRIRTFRVAFGDRPAKAAA
jgi:IS30 family transposase